MNDIVTSVLCTLHPFISLPNDVLKGIEVPFLSLLSDLKGTIFPVGSNVLQSCTFFAVGSDVVKSAKKVPLKSLKI